MKKIIVLFIMILMPISIYAYSKNIIPGGESIGIKIEPNGLIVVGFYKGDGVYIAKNNIKIGDAITKINGKSVTSINELNNLIKNENISNMSIPIEIVRNGKTYNIDLKIGEENNIYKTGLYVKDSVVGLGTLTYIDPISKIYGALGHEIISNETKSIVEVKNGNILMSKVKSINKSRNGHVGSKEATILYDKEIGTIRKNTNKGIYGMWNSKLLNKDTMEIASFNEIKSGDAYIYTVLKNNDVKKYKINIVDKYSARKDTQKAFSFEIVDNELLSKTGGIVQGMSGSPIIQDNKIIGAVTNVLIDNTYLGYGISIVTMLSEGEKS